MKSLFIALLFTTIGNAQFGYGPKAGIVISNLTTSENIKISTESKTSYSIGAFLDYKFSDFSANIDLSYGEYGSKGNLIRTSDSPDDTNLHPEINIKEQMFMTNATANYHITESLSFGAGLYYGIINSIKYDTSFGEGKTDASDYYKSGDFGLIFKTSYNLYKGLFVEAKYNMGLSNVYDYNYYLESGYTNNEVRNRIFTFSVGYKFL